MRTWNSPVLTETSLLTQPCPEHSDCIMHPKCCWLCSSSREVPATSAEELQNSWLSVHREFITNPLCFLQPEMLCCHLSMQFNYAKRSCSPLPQSDKRPRKCFPSLDTSLVTWDSSSHTAKYGIFWVLLNSTLIQNSGQEKKWPRSFPQFLTFNTLSGNKGCNDFPRACTCLIIHQKIDSGTTVLNTKIFKQSKLRGKATEEEKEWLWWEKHVGTHFNLPVFEYLYRRCWETTTDAKNTIKLEQICSYKTLFFNIGTTISYAFSPILNKKLYARLANFCTSRGVTVSHLLSQQYCKENVAHTVCLSLARIDGNQTIQWGQ